MDAEGDADRDRAKLGGGEGRNSGEQMAAEVFLRDH